VRKQAPDLAGQVDAVQRCMEDADQAVVRLSRFVALLFDTARAKTGSLDLQLKPCDLVTIVREQVAALRMTHPQRNIQMQPPGEGHAPVMADADRIEQVVANYLSNALKYSPEDERIVVRVQVRGGGARVSVKDRGPGLGATDQQRIWERFYRAPGVKAQSGSASGLGLGLHICKMLVNAHGGEVGVISAVGKGSTFWFTLPLHGA
jgi:signal transduction histidine kinase